MGATVVHRKQATVVGPSPASLEDGSNSTTTTTGAGTAGTAVSGVSTLSAAAHARLIDDVLEVRTELGERQANLRAALADQLGSPQVVDELYEFYREIANDDDELYREGGGGREAGDATLEAREREQAARVSAFVMARLRDDQLAAIESISQLIHMDDEILRADALLHAILAAAPGDDGSSSGLFET